VVSAEPAVVVERLRVVRGGRVALDDLSATARAGQVTGLLGPSGSGKSTLIRSIVGVQVVESGSVRVFGVEAGSASLRPRIGYMTQAPSVYSDLTVAENLRYFARVLRKPAERVPEVIADVGLEAERDRVVDRLSGGQRARVSLAAALVGEPDLLVLDEPTRGVDPERKAELARLLRAEAPGRGTLVVTHDLSWASEVADRVVELDVLRRVHA
jgi:ABC-2 type transport system ATP-binding protein